jgi:hypothetical protein
MTTKKNTEFHQHSGATGPLDPSVERAHLLARWEEEELTATVPMAPLEDDWLLDSVPEVLGNPAKA